MRGVLIILLAVLMNCSPEPSKAAVRKSALAGSWYSASSRKLSAAIDSLLTGAAADKEVKNPLVYILPHAGYQYSGKTAALGYVHMKRLNPDIIVILAPSHRAYFSGCSAADVQFYETPLGRVRVDGPAVKRLLSHRLFTYREDAHRQEHAIEIHLPFLQRIYEKRLQRSLSIVPVLVGNIDDRDAATAAGQLVSALKGRKRPLFIISSDFTHYGRRFGYMPFALSNGKSMARKLKRHDFGAINYIIKKDLAGFSSYVEKTGITICGRNPIRIALSLPITGFRAEALAYDTSGNISGDFTTSVSYASIVMGGSLEIPGGKSKPLFRLSAVEQKRLLMLARNNIRSWLVNGKGIGADAKSMTRQCRSKKGAFVTLKKRGRLRGCIGYLYAVKPLYETIIDCSYSAAFRDPRFRALTLDEFADIHIEISVLTDPVRVKSVSEIVIGTHGLIMERGMRRGLLLPQVAVEQGWNRETFLGQTCIKAGLQANAWQESSTKIYRFQAIVFGEE